MIICKNKIRSWNWLEYEETESTNDEALLISSDSDADNTIITARVQTNGRGRNGRNWISIEGNLFMTLLLKFDIKDNAALVFMVSLGLLETIKSFDTSIDVKLKWPNDVLVNGKKASGILIERANNGFMAVGVGVNIVSAPDVSGLLYPATSLNDENIKTDRIKFLKMYVNILDLLLAEWGNNGFQPILHKWIKNARGINERISIRTPKEIKTGTFSGVDEYGRVLLKNGKDVEAISAGDVFFEE